MSEIYSLRYKEEEKRGTKKDTERQRDKVKKRNRVIKRERERETMTLTLNGMVSLGILYQRTGKAMVLYEQSSTNYWLDNFVTVKFLFSLY